MVNSDCTSTLSLIDSELATTLTDIVRGVEKEGLRVTTDNHVAQDHHPTALGSTLTHPSITTDYSEALLEFITPTSTKVQDTVDYLERLHKLTLENLDEQVIWPVSMPCRLDGDKSIPIADYGTSNVGTLKHVYRQGLGVRYGRIMQSIAGIHYNFSLPDQFWPLYRSKMQADKRTVGSSVQDFKSAQYFSLIRNFRRYSWILHYLFGASPVLDKSFLNGRSHQLQEIQKDTLGLPYATSLRMSDLGYQNTAQQGLHVSYSSLEEYVTTLGEAMHQSYPPYDEIGIKVDGQYRQLNANVLQIENEYYSDIRPKRVTRSGEKPIAALRDRGVEYIEVRILDINPFVPIGISASQMRFLDAYLLYCLFSQCPEVSNTGCPEIRGNQREVILRGRDPSLTLTRNNQQVPFKEAAQELLEAVMGTAKLLDQANQTNEYSESVRQQQAKVVDSHLTPSGQMMDELNQGTDFVELARHQADRFKDYFDALPRDPKFDVEHAEMAQQSLAKQAELEASDTQSFDDFLAEYNAS
ncbi:glutamate--cysteine ligase [Arenicella xantha]|uniref:Glutamate--cysteine ligase n=1 Tax=Arenicella xantha TaxID=644221 RepID=A0A395JPQ3_9GAMM|nr:glutamate--cysteine ligase [Arenicella xantha]RBP53323.1 glutamate-cysteine ligase [Arenicella xantha]